MATGERDPSRPPVRNVFQGPQSGRPRNVCEGGVAGLVFAVVKDNLRNAIPLLSIVTPRQLTADIHKTEVQITSLADLDGELAKMGLPSSRELFARPAFEIDYRGSAVEDDTEDMVAAAEEPPK